MTILQIIGEYECELWPVTIFFFLQQKVAVLKSIVIW